MSRFTYHLIPTDAATQSLHPLSLLPCVMTIVVNGESRTIADRATIAELLEQLKLGQAACAVEVNRDLVPKPRHPDRVLAEGDRVEIVTLVGGG